MSRRSEMGERARAALIVAVLLCAAAVVAAWACDPPIVIINSPGDGGTVSGTIEIQLSVTSETDVKGVDIYLDENLLDSLTTEPYTYKWDTTKAENGAHKIYVKARATDRKDGVSKTITVTVKNEADKESAASAEAG
jgi:hypothetical protein